MTFIYFIRYIEHITNIDIGTRTHLPEAAPKLLFIGGKTVHAALSALHLGRESELASRNEQ